MAREVFPDGKVGEFYNKNFISIKINAEKGEGIDFIKKYPVAGYPTLIYLKSNGEVVKKITSYADVDHLIAFGKQAMSIRGDLETLK